MNIREAIHLVALASATAFALDDISLAGTLRDESGAPLGGATVSLAGLATTTTTGADGTFLLVGSSADLAGTVRPGASSAPQVVLRNGCARLIGGAAGAAYSLDLVGVDGRILASDLPFVEGTASLPRSGAQARFARLKKSGTVIADWTRETGGAFRKASAGYRLVFAKSGYASEKLSASGPTASGLVDTLVASDPWIPTGAATRSNGQVRIQAAGRTFAMGSKLQLLTLTADPYLSEGWRHSVSFLHDFWMDTTETTQGRWRAIMAAHYGSASDSGFDATYGTGDRYPAYGVYDTGWGAGGAVLFANARSLVDGFDSMYTYTSRSGTFANALLTGVALRTGASKPGYRLPTEAEWEYAARGGTTSDAYWGDFSASLSSADSATISARATWEANSYTFGAGQPGFGVHEVAAGIPNAYGLYDMLGNVSEWTEDQYGDGYAAGHALDPVRSGESYGWRAIRGGNWTNNPQDLRASNRQFSYGGYFPEKCAGFRLVRTAP